MIFHTIQDGVLYDTEIVDPTLRGLSFFANSRHFSLSGAGWKTLGRHTNVVGMGSALPEGYSALIGAIGIEFSTPPKPFVLNSQLTLRTGVKEITLTVRECLQQAAIELVALEPRQCFTVGWKLPAFDEGAFAVRLSLYGSVKAPVNEPGDKDRIALLEQAYGRRKRADTFDLMLKTTEAKAKNVEPVRSTIIHKKCMKTTEKSLLPESAKRRSIKSREALWCRCGEKISQNDQIAEVES